MYCKRVKKLEVSHSNEAKTVISYRSNSNIITIETSKSSISACDSLLNDLYYALLHTSGPYGSYCEKEGAKDLLYCFEHLSEWKFTKHGTAKRLSEIPIDSWNILVYIFKDNNITA